jgi:hypothetical protein
MVLLLLFIYRIQQNWSNCEAGQGGLICSMIIAPMHKIQSFFSGIFGGLFGKLI